MEKTIQGLGVRGYPLSRYSMALAYLIIRPPIYPIFYLLKGDWSY